MNQPPDLQPTPSAASKRRHGNFVLLRADGLRLLLRQEHVEAAQHIESRPVGHAMHGVFAQGEGATARRVVALSERLEPLPEFPSDRFLVTRLAGAAPDLAFAWNEVRVLIGAVFDWHPLPPAMAQPDAPIEGYAELDGELTLCTSPQRLLGHAAPALA